MPGWRWMGLRSEKGGAINMIRRRLPAIVRGVDRAILSRPGDWDHPIESRSIYIYMRSAPAPHAHAPVPIPTRDGNMMQTWCGLLLSATTTIDGFPYVSRAIRVPGEQFKISCVTAGFRAACLSFQDSDRTRCASTDNPRPIIFISA